MNNSIVFASFNSGKVTEVRHYFEKLYKILPIAEFTQTEPEETGLTFIENALIKARTACSVTKLPALADDSGLCVQALGGRPGLLSARYAGKGATTSQNIALLLQELGSLELAKRQATFVTALVYLRHTEDPNPIIGLGKWHGLISLQPIGTNNHGYDPVFFIPEKNTTAAMISITEKNTISSRAKALRIIKEQLANEFKSNST